MKLLNACRYDHYYKFQFEFDNVYKKNLTPIPFPSPINGWEEVGGKGLFVKEVETLLLDQKADAAVHSLKDMPVKLPETLSIIATPKRHSIRDRIIFRSDVFEQKIKGQESNMKSWGPLRIGTSSLRRRCQLKKFLPSPEPTRIASQVVSDRAGSYRLSRICIHKPLNVLKHAEEEIACLDNLAFS